MNWTIENFFKEEQVENLLNEFLALSKKCKYAKYLYKIFTSFKDIGHIPDNLLPDEGKIFTSAEQIENNKELQVSLNRLKSLEKIIVELAKKYSLRCKKEEKSFFGGIMILFTNLNEENIVDFILQRNLYLTTLKLEIKIPAKGN